MYLQIGIAFPNERFQIRKYSDKSIAPMFCLAKDNPPSQVNFIVISMENLGFWCQAIFQMGHEMTHAAIHYNSPSNARSTAWIEETICEAMALFCLNVFACNWERIQLAEINPDYASQIEKYLRNELSKNGNNKLSLCCSYEELKQINTTSQEQREQRKNEMHT